MNEVVDREYIIDEPFVIVKVYEKGLKAIGISKCDFRDTFDCIKGRVIATKRAKRALEKKKKGLKIVSKFAG